MSVLINKIPAHQRRPTGAVMGKIGVGKTTELVRAFPKWAYLLADPAALDAALDLLESNPDLAKEMGITEAPPVAISLVNDTKTEWLSWFENFAAFVNASMTARKKRWNDLPRDKKKANRHLALNFAGSSKALGVSIPEPGVPGFVLTEATTMWQWATATGKKDRGAKWETNDEIADALEVLMSVCHRWNLGLIFDGHTAEAVPERGYARGFNWPFGKMREGAARGLAFIWELVYVSESGTGEDAERYFLTQPGYGGDDGDTIRKTRRFGLPAKLDLSEKSMAAWLKQINFRVD